MAYLYVKLLTEMLMAGIDIQSSYCVLVRIRASDDSIV